MQLSFEELLERDGSAVKKAHHLLSQENFKPRNYHLYNLRYIVQFSLLVRSVYYWTKYLLPTFTKLNYTAV